MVGLVLVVEIRGNWEGKEVILGITEMKYHGVPGASGKWEPFPRTKILLENGLFGKDEVCQVNHLLWSHGRKSVVSKGSKIFDSIEDDINRLGEIEVKVVDFGFFGFDLLGGQLAICGEEMSHDAADVGGILTCCSIEERSEVEGVNGFHNLSNESLFCGLAKFKLLVQFCPNAASSINLGSSACNRRGKGAWIGGCHPWNSGFKGGIERIRE